MPTVPRPAKLPVRQRQIAVLSGLALLLLIFTTYTANAFLASVQLVGTFGVAPWSPIESYVGSVGVIHADSFWQRFLVVESVDYVSDYYRGTEAWIPDAFPGIGVVELANMDHIHPEVHLFPAEGQRLIWPEILIRIDRYQPYEGEIPSDDRDQARITVRFRFLWTRFIAKAGY